MFACDLRVFVCVFAVVGVFASNLDVYACGLAVVACVCV